jgi:nicotinamide-nucleotide amidase
VADALGRPLAFSQELVDAIEERFRRRGRKMAANNKRQAMLIEGAEALPNPNGTAVGQWILGQGVDRNAELIMLLPGPPGELKPMFVNECVPRLIARLPAQVIRARLYRVTGMTESDLDHLIAPVYSKYTNPATTILASPGDIQIHLRARCGTEQEAESLLAEVGDPVAELLGDRIFSRNGDSLEAVVGQLLRARGATLAVAESCTGGMIAERITSVPGSSDYFSGGYIVYSNRIKENLLGIDPALIEKHGAVSEEVARAMAQCARARSGAAYAISTTGEAGPESSTGVPVGTVYVGIAGPGLAAHNGAVEARRFNLPGDRNRIRMFAAQGALDYLRRRLLGL